MQCTFFVCQEKESFAFLEECCHEAINKRKVIVQRMDALCTIEKIISYLKARQYKISRDSYDVFVFLTRYAVIILFWENSFV